MEEQFRKVIKDIPQNDVCEFESSRPRQPVGLKPPALLAYVERQNAVEVRDLPGFNVRQELREHAWQMLAGGWIGIAGGK